MAVAVVLINLAETGVHPAAAGRATLIVVAGAVALQLGLWAAIRDSDWAAILATSILLALALWLPLTMTAEALGHLSLAQLLVLTALASAAAGCGAWIVARRNVRWRTAQVTAGLNLLGAGLLAVSAASVLASPIAPQLPRDLGLVRELPPTERAAEPERPDIYVFILDGHPRPDSLYEQTGYDISPFMTELEALRFSHAPAARTNYDWTGAAISSLLNMELLAEPWTDGVSTTSSAEGFVRVRTAVNQNGAFDVLRAHGYRTAAIGPPWEHVSLRMADEFIDAGQLNSFECHLIRRTAVGTVAWAIQPSLFGDARRQGVHQSLEAARGRSLAESDGPEFVLVHLPVPHPPVLWDPTGSPIDDPRGSDCAPPGTPGMDRELIPAYLATLERVHQLVLETVAEIMTHSDTEPVIILMSDHGPRLALWEATEIDAAVWRDAFGVLFSAYTPEHEDLFPDDVTLVSILPRVFNAYLGTSLEVIDPDLFWLNGSALADGAWRSEPME